MTTGGSTRGSVDGLASSAPLGVMLPAVFADDDLAQRFVGGIDEVLAPLHNVLDCLDAYFTPSLAPADFTRWLGSWVGAETEAPDTAGHADDPVTKAPLTASSTGFPQDTEETAALRAAVLYRLQARAQRGGVDDGARGRRALRDDGGRQEEHGGERGARETETWHMRRRVE